MLALFFIFEERSDNLNNEELKLIIKILSDKAQAQKDIDKTIATVQAKVNNDPNKNLKITLTPVMDEKSIKQAIKQVDKITQKTIKSTRAMEHCRY